MTNQVKARLAQSLREGLTLGEAGRRNGLSASTAWSVAQEFGIKIRGRGAPKKRKPDGVPKRILSMLAAGLTKREVASATGVSLTRVYAVEKRWKGAKP